MLFKKNYKSCLEPDICIYLNKKNLETNYYLLSQNKEIKVYIQEDYRVIKAFAGSLTFEKIGVSLNSPRYREITPLRGIRVSLFHCRTPSYLYSQGRVNRIILSGFYIVRIKVYVFINLFMLWIYLQCILNICGNIIFVTIT